MAYTTINDPSAHFQTTAYTGNAGAQTITNGGNSNLRPDWVWIKYRSSGDHVTVDSNRGATKEIKPNSSGAESTAANGVTGFVADGFTANGAGDYNGSGDYVSWQWAAGGAAPTQTYRVVVVSDSGNKYRFRNSANTATFAQSAVSLSLQQGGTYTFDQSDSTVASHPMKFSTTSDGTHGGGSSYNTGVTYKLDGSTVTESAYVSGFASATTRQIILNPQNTTTLYYYCHYHSGMGGQADQNATYGSTNFDGSILSKVSTNTTAGFSTVTWTGNGTGGATIGHGLGAVPELMIVKKRSGTDNWAVYHHKISADPKTDYINLDGDGARQDSVDRWNDTTPTSTVATLGDAGAVNGSSATYIGYFFTSIKGYSKFDNYFGNNSSSGTFVYTGFKPAFIIAKNTERTQNWRMYDSKRLGYNASNNSLRPNGTHAEQTNNQLDILSNGFKFRSNDGDTNGYDDNHVYWAFAEAPMVASNNVVGLAR